MIHSIRQPSGALGACVLAAAALLCAGARAQKIDDVPPAVQNNVAPNFMFMIDTSGSMNNIVPAAPYSAAGSYTTTCSSPVPAGVVTIKVVNGAPRFVVGSTTYQHTSVSGTAFTRKCFSNTATYSAKLLANSGTASARVPDNSYLDAEYTGHFLNWYFGAYDGPITGWSDRKALSSGVVESRIEIARRAARSIMDVLPLPSGSNATVRVGLSTYRSSSDGGLLKVAMGDFTTSTRSTLKTSIDALTPGGSTPLATTLADIGRYMATGYNGRVDTATESQVPIDDLLKISGDDNSTRNACLSGAASCTSTSSPQPITQWCQRSSIFALTDGRPQNDRGFNNNTHIRDYDGDCSGSNKSTCVSNGAASAWDRKLNRTYESEGSDYMDDVAKLLFDVDWRPDKTKPTPAAGATRAKNNISTYMIGFADPAVQNDPLLINTARQGGGKFIAATDGATLISAFRSAIADAMARDAASSAVAVTNAQITAGTVGYASSYNSGSWYGDLEGYSVDLSTGLQSGPTQWSARLKLQAQGAAGRRIASFTGSAGLPFTATNAASFGLDAALIDYTRGVDTNEGTTYRSRTFLLGDIIDAEPVVVNYDSGAVVFQGANDGMLHAIDGQVTGATAGQELWAYVPRLVHGKLAGRADPLFQHAYLVDGTPATAEISGAGTIGRILVGGLGKGGNGYYALDITDAAAADEAAVARKVLWEFTSANMGYSFGTPLIVNTAAGWRVVVTSGYRNDGSAGGFGGDGLGHVWVLNPQTGAVEKEFVTPSSAGSAIGLAHLAKPASLGASDTVRYVYGGDLQGNVWRVDLDAATGSELVQIAATRAPGGSGTAQPITSAPVVSPVAGSATKMFVYVGTGQYLSIDDVPGTGTANANATQTQTIYGIIDDTSVAAPTLPDRGNSSSCPPNGGTADLVCQEAVGSGSTYTLSHNAVDLASRRGFYLDIPISGGRVNTQAALTRGGTLVFIVNQPSNVVCNPGGSSYMFQLSALTGGAVAQSVGGNTYYDAFYTIGDALSSRPVIVTTADGPRALLRLSDKTTQSVAIHESANTAAKFRRVYMRPLN